MVILSVCCVCSLCCIAAICVIALAMIIHKSKTPVILHVDEKDQYQQSSSIISKESYEQQKSTYEDKFITNKDGTKSLLTFKENKENTKAFIWIHGMNDYFHHYHIADELLKNGFNVYAITLRNYPKGDTDRRYLFYTDDMGDYIEDIDLQLGWILANKSPKKVVLYGHSTGGLVSTAYMHEGKHKDKINGVVLNSPFFDFHDSSMNEFILKNLIPIIALVSPRFVVKSGENELTGPDYFKDVLSRYHFNQNKKLTYPYHVFAGWINTVAKYHTKVQMQKIQIRMPILVLMSSKTNDTCKGVQDGDCVLDVQEIKKYASTLGTSVKIQEYTDAIHDVLLSNDVVVKNAMVDVLQFLSEV